jgi:hypothetical protein
MTNEEFRNWKEHMCFTFPTVAEALGIGVSTAKAYAAGLTVPLNIELACCELWRRQNEKPEQRKLREHNFQLVQATTWGRAPLEVGDFIPDIDA